MAGHLADPAAVLLHLLSIFNFGSQLFDSISSVEQRLKAVENGTTSSTELAKQSQALSELQKTSDKRFMEVTKSIEQLKRRHHTSSTDKNMVARLKEVQDKILQLEDKSMKQQVLIKSLQTQLQHQHTSKSTATWDVVTTPMQHGRSAETQRLNDLEKRYENIERQVTMLKVHVSEMELQLQASLASTYDGSFMWRIPDLKRRRRDAIDGRISSLYSPPFYTAKNGYKMCIRVYLNGDGMGHKTHLSLFFVLMKGEFDALLKWPFDNKVSLILVDQNHRKHIVQTFKPTPESSSFQRPISDMNVASGCPQFCKLACLDDESYTRDDVLFIKCIVDTNHIFHP